jgi:hypothetical protein
MASVCANCGRAIKDAPEARQEGNLWFCTPSCQLQHASKRTRPGHTTSRRERKRQLRAGGRSGPIRKTGRAIGKTIKWTLILGGLLVVAVIVAAIVGVNHAVTKSNKSSHQVSPTKYAQIKVGMTPAQLRRLVGKPEDTSSFSSTGITTVCWTYGVLAETATYSFCFDNGKLATKSRFSG